MIPSLEVKKSSPRYATHARTLEELRIEFLSDLRRRLDHLDIEAIHAKGTALTAVTRARLEIEATLSFWTEIELKSSRQPQVMRGGEP